jgi:hypothetical protein
MQSLSSYLRLALGGLFLEVPVFRAQRDAADGLRRGFLLVLLVGLIVASAALIGALVGSFINPQAATLAENAYTALRESAYFQSLPADQQAALDVDFLTQLFAVFVPGWQSGIVGLALTPTLYVFGWLVYGVVAHLAARALGGLATLKQTLACTALSSAAYLFNIVEVAPLALSVQFLSQLPLALSAAQASVVFLLGLFINIIALREAHALNSRRAVAAALVGPLLLSLVLIGFVCAVLVLAVR